MLPKLERSGEALKRWPYMMAGNFIALLFGMGVIYGYFLLASHAFVWFGLVTIVSYVISLFISALPGIRQLKRRV